VGAAAFVGQGELAFVSARRLYVLDGTARGRRARLHRVVAPAGAVAPAFSPDGRWLAFLVSPPQPYPVVADQTGTLWLAGADGADARPVLADAGSFSWSPSADVLAATVYSPAGHASVCELGPGVKPWLLASTDGPAQWSPDGRYLAFPAMAGNVTSRFTGLLETVQASGGRPVIRYRSAENALILEGWWPDGHGLLAWLDEQNSASLAADGLPLVSAPLSGGRIAALGRTLVYPPFVATNQALSVIAVDAGSDRYLWHDKTILLCHLSGGCAPFPGGMPGPTNVDPALSASGYEMAFVHCGAASSGDFSQASVRAWYSTRGLWVYPITGGNPHLVTAAGRFVADPTWSASGRLLLYVRDDGLWLINPGGGRPARIVTSLFRGAWPNYYYYIDWHDQFAWFSR
jgi:dipeptidyl aminopeptidase/acylaminoacyl peptidase